MKNQTKLYNIIFPIWLLWLFPLTWIVVLPANFMIDFAVVYISLKILKVDEHLAISKKVIIKVWLFGFLSDFIGTAFLFASTLIDFNHKTEFGNWWYHNIYLAISYNPFKNVFAFVWIAAGVLISGLCIYLFNKKFSFNKTTLSEFEKKRLALTLAIATAPYLFFFPTSLTFK